MISTDTDSLTLPLPRKRLSGCACHSPLAHFYIHHSESSILEIHPFTTITHLASQKHISQDGEKSISIQFLFRESVPKSAPQALSQPPLKKSTQWTNRLASLADEEKTGIKLNRVDSSAPTKSHITALDHSTQLAQSGIETALRLEGPYFTPANPEAYKNVICLVAGTGLSGALAISASFRADRARPQRDSKGLSPAVGATCTMSDGSSGRWQRCVVIWTVREKDFVEMPFFNGERNIWILPWDCVLTAARTEL